MAPANLRVDRIKVKSRSADFVPTCGPQFASMLACWATSGDLRNAGACVEAGKLLTMCLKSPPVKMKAPRSNINQHLIHLQKLKEKGRKPII